MKPRQALVPAQPRPAPDLNAALAKVIGEYERFMAATAPVEEDTDAKAFIARHNAGRAALGHREQLVKVARLLNPDIPRDAGAAAILAEARRALALTHEEEQDIDESAKDE
ncbi:hypothetical protein [Plastoroseomonas arctica]|uniref:Uncharacterized protein n=1 Tax=Plastoroseomonas arctica TaxID=1509237 RepID=A0AAF1K1I0_9PROT|nr:hypothetical protein [Plastoroseomonas arctica]MBR0654789.1 hypothetical protein [Plastoroseomonas arctica]